MEKTVLVETSARHAHISQEHLEILFGEGYELTKKKDLSQPGQYACEERIAVIGPKGQFPGVSILGPVRPATQVEISASDARSIGVIPLSLEQVESIVAANPDTVVVIDEAYVDFGGESAVPLTDKYDNLLVVGTFSKSRSMAGARLGYAIGCEALIGDLETLRYSTNPYNVNRLTLAAGLGQLADEETTRRNCQTIVDNRAYTAAALEEMGFSVLPSAANFLFATCPKIAGKDLYLKLKERGILVRHFDTPRLTEYNRITIGSREQMDALLSAIKTILEA